MSVGEEARTREEEVVVGMRGATGGDSRDWAVVAAAAPSSRMPPSPTPQPIVERGVSKTMPLATTTAGRGTAVRSRRNRLVTMAAVPMTPVTDAVRVAAVRMTVTVTAAVGESRVMMVNGVVAAGVVELMPMTLVAMLMGAAVDAMWVMTVLVGAVAVEGMRLTMGGMGTMT